MDGAVHTLNTIPVSRISDESKLKSSMMVPKRTETYVRQCGKDFETFAIVAIAADEIEAETTNKLCHAPIFKIHCPNNDMMRQVCA